MHYVALAQGAPKLLGALSTAAGDAKSPAGLESLAHKVIGLAPGFHRILLSDAQVSLTLCIGDVPGILAEHSFQCDTLIARQPADKWEVQALARRCKRETRLWIPGLPAVHALGSNTEPVSPTVAQLRDAGFQLDTAQTNGAGTLTGRFDPRWTIPTGRSSNSHVQPTPARCAIVGAGIAGASVAHALALRGWQVTVFDRAEQPAGGASGLPVGLAVPHVSLDDSPRSRMSRVGAQLMQQHAEQLLRRGQDWEPTGVVERLPDGGDRWHPSACWVKPAQLVHAWLAHAGIRFVGGCSIKHLHQADGLWCLQDDQGHDLGCFETVVVANAMASPELLTHQQPELGLGADLLDKLAALQAVHGTLSQGSYAEPIAGLPATPINGNGCFIPLRDADGTDHWFAGSTFETDAARIADGAAQHAANMVRMEQLLPMPGVPLVEALNRAPVSLWSSTRCVTHDRLPLVGPVQAAAGDGLWLCAGMGARGLSFSALCAELLVARLGAEPLPLETGLVRSLDINRVRRRQLSAPENSPLNK